MHLGKRTRKKIYEKKKEGSNCSKFPAPVELCWQNKKNFNLGIGITKVGNTYKHMIRKQRNLLDAKIRNALVKCFEEIKRLARSFPLF
jgi:hypothetical protein